MLLWKKTRMTEYPKSTLRTLISLGKRGEPDVLGEAWLHHDWAAAGGILPLTGRLVTAEHSLERRTS